MLLFFQGRIFWLIQAATLFTLFEVAEFSVTCDSHCAFLKASRCMFLQQPVYDCSNDDTHFSSSVSALLEDLPQSIKNSILNGNFKAQNVEDLVKVSPSLLNLIPARQIHFNAENVCSYIRNHSHEASVAMKLINSLNSSLERKYFLENWNGDESNPKIEDIVASALTKWQRDTDWNFLGLVDSSTTVLQHVPPRFLLTFDSKEAAEFLFHLGSKFDSIPPSKRSQVFRNLNSNGSKFLQRAWAVLAVRELPDKITWDKYSFVIPGLTLDELDNLEIDDPKPFLAYDFSPVQVRIIAQKILAHWPINFNQSVSWIKYLTPSQIQKIWRLNFKDLGIMANQTASYVTAKQILLYQLHQLNKKNVKNGKYPAISSIEDVTNLTNGFIAILPLKTIEDLTRSSVLTLESLQKIDTNLISLAAAYYLTDKSNAFNLEKPGMKIIGIQGMLKAIPTAKIMGISGDLSSILLHHLLQYLQGNNILRNLELLKKCRPNLGSADYILKYLLKNEDKNSYFSLLSPKDVARISLSTINSLDQDKYSQHVKGLPHHILAAMLSNNAPVSWTWKNMFNSSNAFHSLLMGLNCNEIRKIEESDFISIIGRYNDDRLKMGKVFPKNLQRCGQIALNKYLLLKSNLYNEPELIDLLEPSDIEAVGGYILTSLPAEEILHAKYSTEIISAIGQLSLPELMLTASRDHLNTLMDEYLNKDIKQSDLLMLRNLIHFISAPNLEKIKPKDLKYIIESDTIDKRLCADSETRKAWADLLISVFGFPSKWNASQLESMGDFMIAFSSDQLDAVDSSQWQLLADVAITNYTDLVEWPKTTTFYQACLSTLIKDEQNPYLEAVKSLQRKYFTEIQKLVGSIKLTIKDDYGVSLDLDESSLSGSLKPKVITPDEETNSLEETHDEDLVDTSEEFHPGSEESSQTTNLYPTTSEKSKMSSKAGPAFKTASAHTVKACNVTYHSAALSSLCDDLGSGQSESNISESNETFSQGKITELQNERIGKQSGVLLTSANFPVITEVSTGAPPDGLTEKEQEYNAEFLTTQPTIITESSLTDFTEFSQSESALMKNLPSNVPFLSKDSYSEEERDISDGDWRSKIVEPGVAEDKSEESKLVENPGQKNSEIVAENLHEGTDEFDLSLLTTTKFPKEIVNEESVAEKPANWLGLFPNFLDSLNKKIITTEIPSSTPKDFLIEENSKSVYHSEVSSSTTTEDLDFDAGDQLSANLFGKEFAVEAKKIQKGFSQLFGIGKGSRIISSTTESTYSDVTINESSASDFSMTSTTVEVPDIDIRSEFTPQAKELKAESTDIQDSDYPFSTEPSTTIFDESIYSIPSQNYSQPKAAQISAASSPLVQQSISEWEEIPPFVFFDVNPKNITILDSLPEIMDMDYEQPQAEVYGDEINDYVNDQDNFNGQSVDLEYPPVHLSANIPAKRYVRSAMPSFSSNSKSVPFKVGIIEETSSFQGNMEDPSLNDVFCDAVKTLGPSAVLALQESDFHSVTNDELLNCIEDLGRLNLPQRYKEIIWQRVKALEVVNMAIGSLAGAWRMDDVSNLKLNMSEDWTLEIVYLLSKYNMDSSVANIIVDKMRKQIFSREIVLEVPEAVTVALGPLLCYFDLTELQLMFQTPGTFMHVIPIISNMMQGCQFKCLSKFATLAVAFMDSPDSWTSDIVALLGPIPAGLDAENWRLFTSNSRAMSGLQPKALECLPQSFLQMMGVEAMANLSPLTTKVITNKQLILLDKQQKDVLISIKYERWSLRNTIPVQKPDSDQTPRPNVEVDLSASGDITTPSIIIIGLLTLLLSWYN